MNAGRSWPILSTALALFAMLFGSGNIAFPLGLGRDLGSSSLFAMIGFFLTAVLVPVLGIVAMALYQGDYRAFLARTGRIPSICIVALCLALMGPLCIIPRCMAFSCLALQWMLPSVSTLMFSICAGLIILSITWKKSGVVELMSSLFGPVKIILLSTVIVYGLFSTAQIASCTVTDASAFAHGLFAGYGTLDLLAVMFFSGLLFTGIKIDQSGHVRTEQERIRLLMKAGVVGALLLGIMYAGFVIVAARHSAAAECMGVAEGQLLSVLASIILGAGGGYLASITMIVACTTTAIALTTVFAEYLHTSSYNRLSYHNALIVTTIISTIVMNLGADGIKAFLAPIVVVLYPALLVLAILNILAKVWRIDLGAWPFYVTLGSSIVWNTLPWITTFLA